MQQIKFIPLEKLKLDNKNPRLPSNFNNKSENDIVEWMLEDESIIELMLAIGQHDFFVGEAYQIQCTVWILAFWWFPLKLVLLY
jgi:hypothetical protein